MSCGAAFLRTALHEALKAKNCNLLQADGNGATASRSGGHALRPDGDAVVDEIDVGRFELISCGICTGDEWCPAPIDIPSGGLSGAAITEVYHPEGRCCTSSLESDRPYRERMARMTTAAQHDLHGMLKPDIVFFGDVVPARMRERADETVHGADAMLVLGSSLHVFSAYRLVRRALERGCEVVVVNDGATRADEVVTEKVDAPCGDVLELVARSWLSSRG